MYNVFVNAHVNTSWAKNVDHSGVGWVLRDEIGNVKWYKAKAYIPNSPIYS